MPDQSRPYWHTKHLVRIDEPYLVSLLKYRASQDRYEVHSEEEANLVSSKLPGGLHMPVIDLDASHYILPSSQEGHSHLYLNVPISHTRWLVLMWGLYVGRVIDKGFFWWSIRRGQNFARINSKKTDTEKTFKATYGWLFKKRKYRNGRK